MSVEIRPIAKSDFDEWQVLFKKYHEFYKTTVTEEVYSTTFARLLDPEEKDQNGNIALIDGKAVGIVHFIYHRHNWRIEKVTYLCDLFVDPNVRGHGVGRKLIESVYKAADEYGAPYVYWTTQEFNTTARKLYDSIGEHTPFIKYQRKQ